MGGQAYVVEEGLETEAATGTRAGPAWHEARAELTLWSPGPERTAGAHGSERTPERKCVGSWTGAGSGAECMGLPVGADTAASGAVWAGIAASGAS